MTSPPTPTRREAPRRRWLLGLIALSSLGGMAWSMSRPSSVGPASLPKGTPVLLDFGMDICTQCKKTRAMLETLRPAYEGRVEIRFLDVRDDAAEALGSSYGMRVIPLLVLLDGRGREVWRHEGVPDEARLRSELDAAAGQPLLPTSPPGASPR